MPAAKRPTKKRATKKRSATTRAAKRASKTTRTTSRTATKRAKKAVRRTSRTATKRAKKAVRKTSRATTTGSRPARKSARKVTKAAKKGTPPAKRGASAKATATGSRSRRGNARDAIAVLKADHRTVEELFKRFERAGDGAARSKRKLVDQVIEELSRHAEIEELIFYPAVRREVGGAESDVLEAIEEHHVVKVLLRELEDLDATHERFDAKVTVLIENVRHHVKEEEQELFPEVRGAIGRSELLELGAALLDAKPRVPTRPHPWAPDEPPGNMLVGGAVAALDKARTVGRQTVQRVAEATNR
jgi:hemerythrin-like domain-containing protein